MWAGAANRSFLAQLCALIFLALGQPVAAQEAPACHAYSSAAVTMEQGAAAGLDWTCGKAAWRDSEEVTWLRFPAGDEAKEFSSRITNFRQITIAAVASDGAIRTRSFSARDAETVPTGAVFRLPLPAAQDETAAYLVRIERPHSVTVASEARISADARSAHGGLGTMLLLTLVAGMLLTPLLFDINFYLVLRERFVVLHAAMTVSMIAYVLFAGGLISAIAALPISFIAVGGPLAWALGVGISAFFMTSFLEKEALPRPVRRLTHAAGWWTMAVPGFFALQLPLTQPYDNAGYFLSFAPVIPVYALVIACALWRGSRAARVLAAAWLPIILASTERLLRGLGVLTGSTVGDHGLFLALGLEVIIIALGVADRFLAVRRERDWALSEARSMEELSEQDPLTGLLNRRALEERFESLRRDGYQTLALVDLDRFKDINDRFGHRCGDDVLRAVAGALTLDRDVLAFRMGGEEFLLLLRGKEASLRAERVRQGIPARIAADIPGLERLVTASMGLIDMADEVLAKTSLATLYERADKLLYEAKAAGRNRTVSERLKLFRPRSAERRKVAA